MSKNKEWLGTKIMGIGSSEAIDTAGEKVMLQGIDITTLSSTGTLNWEHLNANSSQCVGKIIEAKKIFTEDDCDNYNHRLLFDKNEKKPYLFIKGILFDAFNHEGSLAIASILKFDEAFGSVDKERVINFSIEGSRLDTDKNGVVHKCIARKIAVTTQACNKQSFAMICNDDSQDEPIPQTETDRLKSLLQSVFKKSEEEYQDLQKGNELKSPATQKMINDRKTQTHSATDRYQQEIGQIKTSSKMSNPAHKQADKIKTSTPVISGQAFKDKIEAARKNKTPNAGKPSEPAAKTPSNVVNIKSRFPVKKSNNMRNTLIKNAKSGNAAMQPEHLDNEMYKSVSDEIYNRFEKKEELLSVISTKYPELNKSDILALAKTTTYAMEKKLEEYLLKSIGQLTFNKLPKMNTRPDSDVKTIDSPTSAETTAHVVSNRVKQHTDKPAKAIENASKKGLADKTNEGGSFSAPNKKGISSKPVNVAHMSSSQSTIPHEGLHGTFGNLSNKHGLNQQQIGSVQNHLLNMIHPHDIHAIKEDMASKGYKEDSPSHHEEILAHVNNALMPSDKDENRMAGHKAAKQPGFVGPKDERMSGGANVNNTRLRDSWNLIREHAANMTPEKLTHIANSNVQADYKNYKKSEGDDEPEELPILKKPFKSKAQLGYLMSHKDKIGGEAGAKEWLEHTDVKNLPEKVKK